MLTWNCQTWLWTYTGTILSFPCIKGSPKYDVFSLTMNLIFDVPRKRHIFRTITKVVKYYYTIYVKYRI